MDLGVIPHYDDGDNIDYTKWEEMWKDGRILKTVQEVIKDCKERRLFYSCAERFIRFTAWLL